MIISNEVPLEQHDRADSAGYNRQRSLVQYTVHRETAKCMWERTRVRNLQLKNDSSTRNVANGMEQSHRGPRLTTVRSIIIVPAPECCVLTPPFQKMADTWAHPFVQLVRKSGSRETSRRRPQKVKFSESVVVIQNAPGPRNGFTATPLYVLAPIDDHDIINSTMVSLSPLL
jgi:hypothetical protein